MKNRFGGFGILVFITLMGSLVVACSDGGNTTSTSASSSSGSGGGSGGSGGGSGGSGGAGGGVSAQGHPGSELVSGGDVVKSDKYKMVITFGGSTLAPGNAASPNHRLHGGLIGVTEGTK
jgi:hypothetical protein